MTDGTNREHAAPGNSDEFSQARELTRGIAEAEHTATPEMGQPRYVGPDDPELVRRIELEKQHLAGGPYDEAIFGQYAIANIDRARGSGEDTYDIAGQLTKSRGQLRQLLGDDFGDSDGFRTDMRDSGNAFALEVPEGNATGLADALDRLNLEQYESFLRSHFIRERTTIDSKNLEMLEIQKSFTDRLKRAIHDGVIPITMDEANHRLSKVNVVFFDSWSLSAQKGVWSTSPGEYAFETGRIKIIDPHRSREQIQLTTDHEYFHAISGVTAELEFPAKEPPQDMTVKHGIGILTPPMDDGSRRERRFGWLNEAVTEHLAIELRENKKGTYPTKRVILGLLNQRVPLSHFYEAYFENCKEGVGTSKWEQLQMELDEQFEHGILLKLQRMVNPPDTDDDGSEAGTAYLNEKLSAVQS